MKKPRVPHELKMSGETREEFEHAWTQMVKDLGPDGALKTARSWHRADERAAEHALRRRIVQISAMEGFLYALANDGTIWKTKNEAPSWHQIEGLPSRKPPKGKR